MLAVDYPDFTLLTSNTIQTFLKFKSITTYLGLILDWRMKAVNLIKSWLTRKMKVLR